MSIEHPSITIFCECLPKDMRKKAPAAPQTVETQAFYVSKGKTPGTTDTVLVKQVKYPAASYGAS